MTYELIIEKDVFKGLKSVPNNYVKKILREIHKLAIEPYPIGHIKLNGFEHLYRIRVGVYRIIYEVNKGKLIVTVLEAGHRSGIYKK